MTDLENLLAGLSPARRALLERMRAPAPSIPRIADGPAPLSHEQRRLWYLIQLAGEHPIYTISAGFRLRGQVDEARLASALRTLVERHESLRTAFRESAGEPVQEVTTGDAFKLEVLDLREDPWAEQEANYQTDAFGRRRFRLESGETFRALLIRESEGEHRLLIALHHLAGDGESLATLLTELSALYAADQHGDAVVLATPTVRFRDWAAWQQTAGEGSRSEDEEYWRAQLDGARTLLDLPTDRPHPAQQDWAGARHSWDIAPDCCAAVDAAARRQGTTPYVVIASAFALVLSRYSGEQELLLGTVLANRPRRELQGVVGFFTNTLPLRLRVPAEGTVAALLADTHRTASDARTHAGIPFDRLVGMLGIRRDFRRPPLVQAVLTFTPAPAEAFMLEGVEVESLAMESSTSIFELTLLVEERSGGLRATLQYATALWDAESVVRMAAHLEQALGGLSGSDGAHLGEISLATPGEDEEVLRLGDGGAPLPSGDTLHELFARQAAMTPDRTAIEWSGGSLTYRALDDRAGRLAAALRARGVGVESRVAVMLPRTPDLVAALIGVLKAGATCVPMDPTHPASRHEAVLRASRAAVIVHQGSGPLHDVPGIGFAELEAPAGLAVSVDPACLAYVLFTSGSTGGPKGVEIEHRSAAAVVAWAGETLSAEERERVLFSTSVVFDVAVHEIYGTLCWGGTLFLVENALAEIPADAGLSTVGMTPTAAAERVAAGSFPECRTVLLAGEAVPRWLVAALHALPGVQRVLNLYGPTEDTIFSTCAELTEDEERISLGAPLPGGRIQVLDQGLRPAGVGIPGEAWMAGAGVSRGYSGRPGLTAERFVPDPYGPPGSRMYRSFDRLRWRHDGSLEYLGRADAQVKVRGYRVELGEVEGMLARHPGVAAAAAAVRGEGPEQQLVGYLVPSGSRPEPADLRASLREALPEYMVPTAWVYLDALPTTASGKVDRRALPEPTPVGEGAAGGYLAPRTPLEARLAGIWSEVLEVPRVGVSDDFFDLGGQSILATRLVARVRTELDADLPVAELLHAPTVEAMANAITAREQRVRPPLVALQKLGSRRPLFLAHPAGGHVVCYRGLAVLLAPEQPVYALQPRGVDDGLMPLDRIPEMAAHYLAAIRRLQPTGPYRLAGWSFGGIVAWEMADQLVSTGEEVELLALLDTAAVGEEGLHVDPRDTPDVVWSTVAGLAGFAAASRVDVESLRGMEVREAALAMIRGIESPRILDETRVDDVVALTRVRGANLRAQLEYRPRPIPVHLSYFRTAGSALMDDLSGAADYWSALALGGVSIHPVSGSHGLILNEPHVRVVVEEILALG